jgi:hypothetical protein
MDKQNTVLMIFLSLIMVMFLITGLVVDTPTGAIRGFLQIQVHPGRLLNDFLLVGGVGGTLINAALAGAVGLVTLKILKVSLSGPSFAAILTIMGFGFFGKTPLNILPILLGVFLAAKYAGITFREYIIIALFGTALGPLVSFTIFEIGLTGFPAIAAGILVGTATGFILPALAVTMLHLHQGYNLYNMGFTCGFIALFSASLIRAAGHQFQPAMLWYTESTMVTTLLIPLLSASLIITGIIMDGKESLKNFLAILKLPGRLPSDFMDLSSTGSAFINSGLLGVGFFAYLTLIGADLSGPVIGGVMTVMGFGAFGTHIKNSWPVLVGIILSTLVFGRELASPGPVLAAIFGTTLAPLAGQFGIFPGILAGFIHLFMVLQTGGWQGGVNLYNNGFSGGLTATIIIALIQWHRSNKKEFYQN